MPLKETQALLARLYTDDVFREAFFRAPLECARRYGLGEAEAETLARIDRAAVARFADCLKGKRALDARKTLPLTQRALGARFDSALYAAISGPPAPGRHRADAAALARRLARFSAEGRAEPVWIGDLARFEMAFVTANSRRTGLWLRFFRYPVAEVATRLARGDEPGASRRPSVGVWLRLFGSRLFYFLA
ncbi:hypothetical protein IY145_04085 [Methylosinus sp. H3A]|uniref:hypothetical protein n=1 Tax=Methylosinus sp. H3A TaxID=2785786 RepID=UPI0018C312FF|nr:hypothetical protein [Methylosinus sp. H3A]MBG0808548.1 hypothetical protein [Methylosinus sp. H3A]